MVYDDIVKTPTLIEWTPHLAYRDPVYVFYLAIPMYIFRYLGLDYRCVIACSPYFSHLVLISIGDYYFYKVTKILLGQLCAKLSFMVWFFNIYQLDISTRTQANGYELTLFLIAFYHFIHMTNNFDWHAIMFGFFIMVSFLVRSTGCVAYLGIIAYSVFFENRFFVLLKACLFISIPLFVISTIINSLFYGRFTICSLELIMYNMKNGMLFE